MDNQSNIFRKKSLDRISSLDQLDDYIKVTSPGVWIVLIAVILVLVGTCIWGAFGSLQTKMAAPVIVQGGRAYLFVSEDSAKRVSEGTEVTYQGISTSIDQIGNQPVSAASVGDSYFLHAGGFNGSEWLIVCMLNSGNKIVADGVYQAEVLVESVSPIYYIMN